MTRWMTAAVTAWIGSALVIAWCGVDRVVPVHGAEDIRAEETTTDEDVRHFETRVAPVLARHCLECHGARSRKARLDLSRRNTAIDGGNSGQAVVPGNAEASLLWQYVAADEMPPENRPRLSEEEKKLLREWIEAGAAWSESPIGAPPFSDERIEKHREFECDEADRDPGPAPLRRLTVPEYVETVWNAVGVEIEQEARRLLPPDIRADGFSNTAYNLNVDLANIEAYAELSRTIVRRMNVTEFASQFSRSHELTEESLRELVAGMGKWLLRGPLEQHEIAAYVGVALSVAGDGGRYDEAVGYVVEAMLQSPRFLYMIEDQRGDGAPRPISDYELASRLSYILWGGPPDRELLEAADAGELSHPEGVEAQVRRMLEDPRAVARSGEFIHQWLNLDQLDNLRPNSERFPEWDEQLAADMRDETLAFFQHVAWEQQRPLSDLMNAQVTFLTPRLAEHYGLDPSHSVAGTPRHRAAPRPSPPSTNGDVGGLVALYRFDEGEGDTIRDRSGAGQPLDLKIEEMSAVAWVAGGLRVEGSTLIATRGAPTRLIQSIKASNEATLEAWITPADTDQTGPARILTLSSGIGVRNVTLGQEGNRYDVRFRTTTTDPNGVARSITSPSGVVEPQRATHVAYTRISTGTGTLYVNGEEQAGDAVDGTLANWDEAFQLALGNETSKDRPWRGTFHQVAIHSRAMSADEIRSRSQGLTQYDLASVPARGGLLTQGSTLTAGGDEASMVARGLFILQDILSSGVDDPPPCVDTTPAPTTEGLSQRGLAEARLSDSTCVGCHARFEPLAFGLEKFDGIGAYHEVDEHGNRLRDDGDILFPGQDEPISYQTSGELMDNLAGSQRIRETITLKLTQFSLGRPLVQTDACALAEIHRVGWDNGGTYASLIRAIVTSDLVRMIRTESDP